MRLCGNTGIVFIFFRGLKLALASGLYEFLRTRGVNDDLSLFLHEYMMNKDKGELINWLGKVKKFFET